MRVPENVTKVGHQCGHPSTLLFWRSRMMCSKQLLLRKTACRTGRSSQLSMAGMASTARRRRLSTHPTSPSPSPSPTTYPA